VLWAKVRRGALLVVVLAVCASGGSSVAAWPGWTEPVALSPTPGFVLGPRMKVDQAGFVHLIYKAEHTDLIYLRWDGQGWSEPEIAVTLAGERILTKALAVGSDGRAHAVFWTDDHLYYTVRNEDGWSPLEVVASWVKDPDIAVDKDGRVYVVYVGVGRPNFAYLRIRDSAGWGETQLLLVEASSGEDKPSIKIDRLGVARIAWGAAEG